MSWQEGQREENNNKSEMRITMIYMSQVKVPVEQLVKVVPENLLRHGIVDREERELLKKRIGKILRIQSEKISGLQVLKKSMDARKHQQMQYIYQVQFSCPAERQTVKRYGKQDAKYILQEEQEVGKATLSQEHQDKSPVVVGFGPAGMFAALTLARAGYAPRIIERGMEVDRRQQAVDLFWKEGKLNPECNVQFGEGGAGTFSDGKLNTLVKDKSGRNRRVLHTLAEFGAPGEILYLQKPHIGTDVLKQVVRGIREEIIRLGGSFSFETKLVDIETKQGKLSKIILERDGKKVTESCDCLILATGHSARDTFYQLYHRGIYMEPKAFAVGVRVEHLQEMIGRNQYGSYVNVLPAADYKLTYQTREGRGVYSFCMCPGGYVVNASSEEGRLAVNGMSYYARDGVNANSAIIVTVTPEDFGPGVFAGVEFQRKYEALAYEQGQGKIPVQLLGDFAQNRKSTSFGAYYPAMKGQYLLANVREALPKMVGDAIIESMQAFDRRISGYAREDTILSGIESRTSSPVRILRDEMLQSNVRGIYPCGEGAGYAGGITSAAMDGIRVAEEIIH